MTCRGGWEGQHSHNSYNHLCSTAGQYKDLSTHAIFTASLETPFRLVTLPHPSISRLTLSSWLQCLVGRFFCSGIRKTDLNLPVVKGVLSYLQCQCYTIFSHWPCPTCTRNSCNSNVASLSHSVLHLACLLMLVLLPLFSNSPQARDYLVPVSTSTMITSVKLSLTR